MSEWQIKSFYYLKANSESEAWSLANLELPAGSQITSISESERASEPLCGDHLVPVSQCDCLWGYKRERAGK